MTTAIDADGVASNGSGARAAGGCPVAAPPEPPALTATEPLFIPHPKRLLWTYDVSPEGGRELRINYGVKEITFDDERFFGFGERLASEPSFTGELATTWGPGYAWDELAPLLASLIEERILQRGERRDDPRGTGVVPSKLPPAPCPRPRSWSLAECEAITRDLGNRAIEVGHLEAVVPVFRIAHPALDGDGRQVGEANVFPTTLRIERDTEWRVCQYPGSRYRDDTPMNVTALKAMIKHWKPMLGVIVAVRDAVQARLGLGVTGWTIGELHHMASVVCALPAFALLLRGGASPQVPLHPVLSSMFRVTDGVRMATHEMMFDVDATRQPDEPLTAAELYAHAERNGSLMGSKTGVCAGPRHMIEEYFAAVIDGVELERYRGVEQAPEVQAVLEQLPAVIDYGLLGLQSWGLAVAVWLAHSEACEAVLGVLETAIYNDACSTLRTRLRRDWNDLGMMQMSLAHDREVHRVPYAYSYETSWRALAAPHGPPVHGDAMARPAAGAMHEAAAPALRAALVDRLAGSELLDDGAARIDQLVAIVIDYLRAEQGALAATSAVQAAINAVLERPAARRPLEVRDIHAIYTMQGGVGAYPYLLDSLEATLGLAISCTADAITVADRQPD